MAGFKKCFKFLLKATGLLSGGTEIASSSLCTKSISSLI